MGEPGDETTWTAAGAPAVAAALAALGERYQVVDGATTDVRRIWLDTADWRLYRAGACLALVPGEPGGVLELSGPAGAPLLTAPDLPGPAERPRLLGDLPDPVRGRLTAVLDIRAVCAVARVRCSVASGTLLDTRARTAAHFEHHQPALAEAGDGTAPMPLLTVRATRTPDAARIAKTLRRAGLTQEKRTPYQLALAGAGADPDAVRPPAMQAGLPATTAVARVLLGFLDEMESTVEGTIADVDSEFLHDFRVAVRRSRSAVKLLGEALPARSVTWAGPQLKWLGDLTTPVRDLDVHLLGLPEAAARLRGGRPEDLEPLAAYLTQLRDAERRTLTRGLRSARFTRFRRRWRAELEPLAAGPGAPAGATGPVPVASVPTAAVPTAAVPTAAVPTAATAVEFGASRLRRAHQRVLRPGSRITAESPPEDLHDLRKRGKELRYLLEIFAGLLRPEARPLVKELKGLQDVLGTFQDSEVQRAAVVGLAEAMLAAGAAPAATLLAMGEIAAQLYDQQFHAREEFSQRFERFAAASPSGGLLS